MMKAHESLIGQRIIKPDAAAKVTGQAKFTADLCRSPDGFAVCESLIPALWACKDLVHRHLRS